MTPEDGVGAHVDVRGELLIPVHWATFNLALHDWARAGRPGLAGGQGATASKLAVPRPGERVDVDKPADGRRLVAGARLRGAPGTMDR